MKISYRNNIYALFSEFRVADVPAENCTQIDDILQSVAAAANAQAAFDEYNEQTDQLVEDMASRQGQEDQHGQEYKTASGGFLAVRQDELADRQDQDSEAVKGSTNSAFNEMKQKIVGNGDGDENSVLGKFQNLVAKLENDVANTRGSANSEQSVFDEMTEGMNRLTGFLERKRRKAGNSLDRTKTTFLGINH